jgi:Bifunctional DNA primase/polymerase, N-terminal/Primase C terminal 1 (PriCT-1)
MRFIESQRAYARHGVALFPMRLDGDGSKKPLIRNYQRIGSRASAMLTKRFGDAAAFGFVCGEHSRITVLDIDDADERVLANTLECHGRTPLVVRTARRRFQAWYRWNGERRQIRPDPARPIDILGAGVVVAPDSSAPHGQYQIIEGRLDDVDRLPTLAKVSADSNGEPGAMMAGSGRNNRLFRQLGREAHYCDDFDSLLDCARTLNEQFGAPLEEAEVIRTAKSVWKMTTEGRNRFGQHGAWLSVSDVDQLVSDPYLCTLLSWLKAHNRSGRHFFVADGLKDKFGWPRRQFKKTRRRAIDGEWIVQASAPRRGHAAAYSWGPAAKRADQVAGKKIGSVYVEDSLPKLVGHSVCPNKGRRGRP